MPTHPSLRTVVSVFSKIHEMLSSNSEIVSDRLTQNSKHTIAACENDWVPISQSCAYYNYALSKTFQVMISLQFETKTIRYQEASDLCESMGGFMVDDLNGDKTYWIGSTF